MKDNKTKLALMNDIERNKLFERISQKKKLKKKKALFTKYQILLIMFIILLIIILLLRLFKITTYNKNNKNDEILETKILNLSPNNTIELLNATYIGNNNLGNNSNITNNELENYFKKYNISNITTIYPTYKFDDYKQYFYYSKTGKLLYENNLLYSENPKISVIIALYNAEKYINGTLISIQNQKMKDIEIIIVDDNSTDNSVKYVEEAQKKDPRINLYKNKENMGCFYSKALAALKTRGKYIFLIDNDDQIIIDDLFDVLYEEMEKTNIDIIEYSWINSYNFNIEQLNFNNMPYCTHAKNTILIQPKLRRRFCRGENGKFQPQDRYIWGRIIKRKIYIKALEMFDKEEFNRRIIIHDDTIITFMLFKVANSFIKIEKIGLVHFVYNDSSSSEKRKFITPQTTRDTCLSYINFIELVFKYSENDTLSREEAFWAFDKWYLKSRCKDYFPIKERANKLAISIFHDPYIKNVVKNKIKNSFFDIFKSHTYTSL